MIFVQQKVRYRSCIQHDCTCIFNENVRIIVHAQTTSKTINKELLIMTISGKGDWKSKVRGRITFHCINFGTA